MNLRKPQVLLIFFAALLFGFIGAYGGVSLAGDSESETELSRTFVEKRAAELNEEVDLQKVSQAYELIKDNYLEDIEDKELIEGAIQGMLSTLEDPYTSYLDLESMEEFNEQIESSFEGIGAEVSLVNGVVTIVSPIKDSPAEKAGLRPNDQVLSVDGESLEGLNLNEAVSKIRGEKDSEVTLEILRSTSSESFEVVIIRDKIPVETVYSRIEENGKSTGVIEITNFSENTAKEFEEHLTDLESEHIDGLIIDVRGNPGGLLNVVEDILGFFIPKDMPYLQIEDANGNREAFHSRLSGQKEYPISVIINEGSASASEILAVALKELGYDIVGQTSYGKGTVQTAVPLGDGSSIKMTTFKWLSPNGEWINEVGVEPSVEVEQPEYYYANPITVERSYGLDDASPEIANVQVVMEGLGYKPGRTDGYFSEQTKKAVENFQTEHNLAVTGEIDEQTAGMIESEVIKKIRGGEDDLQLEKALEELYR